MRAVSNKVPLFLRKLIKNPLHYVESKNDPLFTIKQLHQLSELIVKSQKSKPNFAKFPDDIKEVCIVGDLHGDITSTWRIVKLFLNEQIESLVFLGDYVDRGEHSLLVLGLILSLILAWPNRVIGLRGNHEDLDLNYHYGMTNELKQYYPSPDDIFQINETIERIYDHLPLAAQSPQGSICMHGGIPKYLKNIHELNQIPKPHSNLLQINDKELMKKFYRIFYQIRWNDPREQQTQPFQISGRGSNSITFNEEVVSEFVNTNRVNRIVRSHESSRGGFQTLFNGQLLHIFSSEPYYGRVPKAYVLHEQHDETTILRDLDFNPVQRVI